MRSNKYGALRNMLQQAVDFLLAAAPERFYIAGERKVRRGWSEEEREVWIDDPDFIGIADDMPEHVEDAAWAYGYLRGVADAFDITVLTLLEEYDVKI